ncbi:MAG TPA: hypothetical protein VIH75_00030 [Candidatus Sulfotelmatobacter sp.]
MTKKSDFVHTSFISNAVDSQALSWTIGSKPSANSKVERGSARKRIRKGISTIRGYRTKGKEVSMKMEQTAKMRTQANKIRRTHERNLGFLVLLVSALFVNGADRRAVAHRQTPNQSSAVDAGETAQAKIARAMSAGPANVANGARIVDDDARGQMVVLREGNNGFTCMPGNPKVVADPPMCVDAPALQWYADAKAHKPKPTNTVPGITYMLAGATQHSDSDPHDATSMPIEIGPHWMIMWPFDPKATGLPTAHKPTGAYIMWAGSSYAHLHVMGRP